VQVQRVTPGRRVPARLAGSILARDLVVSGARWSKGRRLTADDLANHHGIKPGTLRVWVTRGQVARRGRDHSGRQLYDVRQALADSKAHGKHTVMMRVKSDGRVRFVAVPLDQG